MVRNYVKKENNVTEGDLESAVNRVLNGTKKDNLHAIAKQTGIGRQKLRNAVEIAKKTREDLKNRGRSKILAQDEEEDLVQCIMEMCELGFPPTTRQIVGIVRQYCEANEVRDPRYVSPGKVQKPRKYPVCSRYWQPRKDWVYDFMDRHKLSLKRLKGMHFRRYENLRNPFLVEDFYDKLEGVIAKLGIQDRPECVWNLDESGFPSDPNNTNSVTMIGQKVEKVAAGTGRDNTTVLAACNAAGNALPPLVVFSTQQKSDVLSVPTQWLGDKDICVPGTWYGLSSTGWMTSSVFFDWFKSFCERVPDRPLLLVFDGHMSHITVAIVKYARSEKVTILKLPSHTSSVLQPLDRSVFGPMKTGWSEVLTDWIMTVGFPPSPMNNKQFVNQLNKVWFQALSPHNVKSGFVSTGIFPVNRSQYDQSRYNPVLLQKYKDWVAAGRPEDIPVTDDEDTAPNDASEPNDVGGATDDGHNDENADSGDDGEDGDGEDTEEPGTSTQCIIRRSLFKKPASTPAITLPISVPVASSQSQCQSPPEPAIAPPSQPPQHTPSNGKWIWIPDNAPKHSPSGSSSTSGSTPSPSFASLWMNKFGTTKSQPLKRGRIEIGKSCVITEDAILAKMEAQQQRKKEMAEKAAARKNNLKTKSLKGKNLKAKEKRSQEKDADTSSSEVESEIEEGPDSCEESGPEEDSDMEDEREGKKAHFVKHIHEVNEELKKEESVGKFFAVAFEKQWYLGRLEKLGSSNMARFSFFRYRGCNLFVAKKGDVSDVDLHFVYYGPIVGTLAKDNGFEFGQNDVKAMMKLHKDMMAFGLC